MFRHTTSVRRRARNDVVFRTASGTVLVASGPWRPRRWPNLAVALARK